jgi:hypothetical protein
MDTLDCQSFISLSSSPKIALTLDENYKQMILKIIKSLRLPHHPKNKEKTELDLKKD